MKPRLSTRRKIVRTGLIAAALALVVALIWSHRGHPNPKPPAIAQAVEEPAPASAPTPVPAAALEPQQESEAVAQEPASPPVVSAPAPIAQPAASKPATVATNSTPVTPIPSKISAVPSAPKLTQAQGTALMYLAHASLREPEEANPDSHTNQVILQTMLAKALNNAASAPSTSVRR